MILLCLDMETVLAGQIKVFSPITTGAYSTMTPDRSSKESLRSPDRLLTPRESGR